MTLEILCMIFTSYVFLCGEWNLSAFEKYLPSKLIWFLEEIFPKFTGIMILIYVVLKYIIKLK